jgi:hypothetical protein
MVIYSIAGDVHAMALKTIGGEEYESYEVAGTQADTDEQASTWCHALLSWINSRRQLLSRY